MATNNQHLNGKLGCYAKALAPKLARLFESQKGQQFLRMGELYINALQGKGAAGAWNFQSELAATSRFVHSGNPVIFEAERPIFLLKMVQGNWRR